MSDEWDKDILQAEIEAIYNTFDDIETIADELNISQQELDAIKPEIETVGDDDIPEEVTPITKSGDIWELGRHRVLCGDSTKEDDVNRLMDGRNAVFLFTSPPYSDMREYNNNKNLEVNKIVLFIDTLSKYVNFMAVNLGIQRKNNKINPYWDEYIKQAEKNGLYLTSWNVWSKKQMGGSIANMAAMFPIEHEWIFIFGGNKDKINNTKKNKTAGYHTGISNRQKDGTTKKTIPKKVKEYGRMGTVIEMCYEVGNIKHPAAFPVSLAEEYIKACSNAKENICEPFCGSGSTLIACEKTNRICYGIEIDPHYCDVIRDRYIDFCSKNGIKTEIKLNGKKWTKKA